MKKEVLIGMLAFLLIPALTWARDIREVKPEKDVAVVLMGESFTLKVTPGEVCVLPDFSFPLERPDETKPCSFRAVNFGSAEVEVKGLKTKKVTVKSVRANELPRVMIADLTQDPGKYGEGLIMIEGENRGWGAPAKAKKVWGELVSRSDWILEDETGAAYISGMIKPAHKFARVVVLARKWQGKWALEAVRVEEAEVVLKHDEVNVLRVGQVGVILASPSKSHTPEVKVKGEAVKLEKDERDIFILRGVAEGEAEAELYHHWWNQYIGLGGSPANPDEPVGVFKIKVVK